MSIRGIDSERRLYLVPPSDNAPLVGRREYLRHRVMSALLGVEDNYERRMLTRIALRAIDQMLRPRLVDERHESRRCVI